MKKYFIQLIIGCLLFSSCSDWLDILPKNEQVTANYWKTKEDVESVLASGYYYMRTSTPYILQWGELRGSSVYSTSTESSKLQNFQLTANSSICEWGTFYQVINMANSVIAYAPTAQAIDETYSEAAMYSHQTEAYFMRALMYFYLVRNFKEVPLIIQPYVDDTAPFSKAKSTEAEIITQIKEDITTALETEAAKEFFEADWNATKGRATKWALYALMADVCLWSEDYDNCVIYANNLLEATSIHRPAFMTVPEQWFSIFNPGNSNESVFELNWDKTTYGQTDDSPSSIYSSSSVLYRYNSSMLERLMVEAEEVEQNGSVPIRTLNGAYILDGEIGYIWKYTGTEIEGVVRVNSDANLIVYRMADVMLMKAEALIWKGQDYWEEALKLINQVRNRTYLSDLQISLDETDEQTMLEYVLYERDIELAAEGKRWYDLVRFGKSKNYKYKDRFIDMILENNSSASKSWIRSVLKNDYAWYLPISESEIEDNELLEQNPYYVATTN